MTSIADNVDHDTNRSITSERVIWEQSHFSSCVTATEESLVIHFEFFLSLASSLATDNKSQPFVSKSSFQEQIVNQLAGFRHLFLD